VVQGLGFRKTNTIKTNTNRKSNARKSNTIPMSVRVLFSKGVFLRVACFNLVQLAERET
jgi:hypothetical protein